MTWISLFQRFQPIRPDLAQIGTNWETKKKNATQHQCTSSGVTRRTLHQTPVQHLCSRIGASKSFSLMHLLHHLVMGGLRPNMLRACHHSNTSLFFYLAKPITSILLFTPIQSNCVYGKVVNFTRTATRGLSLQGVSLFFDSSWDSSSSTHFIALITYYEGVGVELSWNW